MRCVAATASGGYTVEGRLEAVDLTRHRRGFVRKLRDGFGEARSFRSRLVDPLDVDAHRLARVHSVGHLAVAVELMRPVVGVDDAGREIEVVLPAPTTAAATAQQQQRTKHCDYRQSENAPHESRLVKSVIVV